MSGATEVEVAVVDAASVAAMVDAVDEGDELAVSSRPIAGTASVDVALVEVAVSAATMPVLKVPIIMRLITRTLAAENVIVVVFI